MSGRLIWCQGPHSSKSRSEALVNTSRGRKVKTWPPAQNSIPVVCGPQEARLVDKKHYLREEDRTPDRFVFNLFDLLGPNKIRQTGLGMKNKVPRKPSARGKDKQDQLICKGNRPNQLAEVIFQLAPM